MSNKENKTRGPMGPGMGGGFGAGEKAKDFSKTMKELLNYIKVYKFRVLLVVIFALGSTIFSIIGPSILGSATTLLAEGIMSQYQQTGGIDFSGLANILLFLIVIYVISGVFSYLQYFIMSGVTQRVAYTLRKEISKKMNKIPLSYFDRTTQGEVLSRVTNDVDTISRSLNQSMQQAVTSVITIIGIFIMMLTISWQLTIMALVVIPISGILAMQIIKRSQGYFKAQQNTLAEVNGHVEEMYGSHIVVKAFNGEERSIATFKQLNDKLYTSAWKSQFLSGLMMPISTFIGNLGYVGVCILGGVLAASGSLSIGDIQAFIQYVRRFNQPITQAAQILNVLQSTAAAAERVFDFLAEEEMIADTENPIKIVDEQGSSMIKGNVSFENVKFGYDADKIIINDFSAYFKSGSKIAIVGPTGAGKTTIVKLLMRFYELNSGTIYIDGHDIKDLTRSDLRSLVGMVLQDAWLFNGTIMENLRYGNLEASDEEVVKAADLAYVDHFIRTLEQGYNTEINEDSTNVSQGQKQLLTIARAFLADPKILILDEATSSVDTRTEVLIQKGMNNLMEGRTSFIIAHRLSTIRDADCIIVMNAGDIVELGTHDELLERESFYASLYNSQFSNEEE